ncbi:hypothetical protein ACU61A_13095 [Pseudonocardia sichuanensis]
MPAPQPARPGRRRAVVAALAATAALALAGCAADEVPAPAPPAAPAPAPPQPDAADPPPDEATIAWTGTVCSAVAPVVETLRTPPPVDFTNAAATREAYLAYIDATLQDAEQAVRQVRDAGAPPVEGGDELTQEVRTQVEDLTEDLTEARVQLERADPDDVGAIGHAVATVGNLMGSLGNSVQAIGEIRTDPRLDAAFEQAPECRQLTTIGEPS